MNASSAAAVAMTADLQTSAAQEGTTSVAVSDGSAVAATVDGSDPNQTLVFQTDDGLILIRQPDGNFQVQSSTGAPINMDTVRALINQLQFA